MPFLSLHVLDAVNDLASWLAERDLNAPAPRDSPTASMDGDDTGMKRHEVPISS